MLLIYNGHSSVKHVTASVSRGNIFCLRTRTNINQSSHTLDAQPGTLRKSICYQEHTT
jgi:hypothetical protein